MRGLGKLATTATLALVVSSTSALAVTYTVDDDGPADFSTIQSAIIAALNGDDIVVKPGRYRETVNFLNKAITVRSESGPADTVIFLEGETRIILLNGDSTLRGFTITGGRARVGGGIQVTGGASPVIEGNIIEDNQASRDGSAFPAFGGGIAIESLSEPVITRNVIRNNRAVGDVDGLFAYGGGIDIGDDTSAVITNNLIVDNQATDSGGAISVGLAGYTIPVDISHNTVVGNQAGDGVPNTVSLGGGVLISDGAQIVLRNNIFAANESQFDGGGVYFFGNGLQGITYEANDYFGNVPNDCAGLPAAKCDGGQLFLVPGFEDALAGRYRLLSDSPLLDLGAAGSGIASDFDGGTRPTDGDLDGSASADPGAFENNGESTRFRFDTVDILAWDGSINPSATYELYRDDLTALGPGALGQCQQSGLTSPTAVDGSTLAPDRGYFYLVRAVATVPGALGFASSGAERLPAVPCP